MSINTEPVAITEAVKVVLALLVAFGLGLTGVQVAAVLAVIGPVMAVFVRRAVTPNANVPVPEDEDADV